MEKIETREATKEEKVSEALAAEQMKKVAEKHGYGDGSDSPILIFLQIFVVRHHPELIPEFDKFMWITHEDCRADLASQREKIDQNSS